MPRKRATARRRPAIRCSWSNRCKRRPSINVDPGERYCKTHAKWLADTLVGNFVKERDNWRCVHCGSSDSPQWAHVISRGAPYIRYDPENSFCLAVSCHQNFTLKPAAWNVWVELNYPGLWTRLVHREIEGERRGGSVDVAGIIEAFRAVPAA